VAEAGVGVVDGGRGSVGWDWGAAGRGGEVVVVERSVTKVRHAAEAEAEAEADEGCYDGELRLGMTASDDEDGERKSEEDEDEEDEDEEDIYYNEEVSPCHVQTRITQ
jgi:hypothetical protein